MTVIFNFLQGWNSLCVNELLKNATGLFEFHVKRGWFIHDSIV